MNILQLKNVRQAFVGNTLFEDVNIFIPAGSRVVLDAEIGSGKSIFMKLLAGLFRPSSGVIMARGAPYTYHLNQRFFNDRKKNSPLLEGLRILENLSLFENLALPLRVRGIHKEEEVIEIVEQNLQLVNLAHKAHLRPAHISMEERSIIAIMMLIKENSDLFIIDEIFSLLNESVHSQIVDLLMKKINATNAAVVLCREDQRVMNLQLNWQLHLENKRIRQIKIELEQEKNKR